MNPTPTASDTFFGRPKLPARHAALVMPLFLSILVTFIVSMVSTLHGIGLAPVLAGRLPDPAVGLAAGALGHRGPGRAAGGMAIGAPELRAAP